MKFYDKHHLSKATISLIWYNYDFYKATTKVKDYIEKQTVE